jgi:hypothetical protein
LPSGLRPSLREARDDKPGYALDHCQLQDWEVRPRTCVYGDRSAAFTVVLLGDSHAGQWFPAIEAIALERHWRLIPYTKNNCRFMEMREYLETAKREYVECAQWRDLVVPRISDLHPDLVIVGGAMDVVPMDPVDATSASKAAALAAAVRRLSSKVAIIVDTPQSSFDVPACLASNVADVTPCSTPRPAAFLEDSGVPERAAAAETGAAVIDLGAAISRATHARR